MEDLKISRVENNSTRYNDADRIKDSHRKPTVLNLQWLAERARKVERIKKQHEDNSYYVDSKDIAKAILNLR